MVCLSITIPASIPPIGHSYVSQPVSDLIARKFVRSFHYLWVMHLFVRWHVRWHVRPKHQLAFFFFFFLQYSVVPTLSVFPIYSPIFDRTLKCVTCAVYGFFKCVTCAGYGFFRSLLWAHSLISNTNITFLSYAMSMALILQYCGYHNRST